METRPTDGLNITSELLLETGFHLPGREEHVPLVIEPITITSEEKVFLETTLPVLSNLIMQARAFDPEEGVVNEELLKSLKHEPAIWRFDFLITPDKNFKMLELNATRPGGIWLLLKAKEALAKANLDVNNFWTPDLAILAEFFQTLAVQSNNPLIALAYTRNYVGEIEMPNLAMMLNQFSRDNELQLEFISDERRHFISKKNEGIKTPDGRDIGVFYENAGPEEQDGEIITSLFEDQYPKTRVINSQLSGSCDNKTLMAVLHDERFGRYLSPEQKSIIKSLVPSTFLLKNPQDLEAFLSQRDRYFFKIGDGLRASSGKGVYDGVNLNSQQIEEIKELLKQGIRFVAQERIPPTEPHLMVSRIEFPNRIIAETSFVDLDPYVFYDGKEFIVAGALARAKAKHPINLTQGGALSVVKIR